VGTGFHPELTGRENIYLSGAILGMKKTEINRKFDEIVAFAEVEKFIDTPVKRYSSGMYVRLAFAVAAHLEPEILLVDEVLAVGDAAFQKKCLGKMDDVGKEGRTVLFVSHNMGAITRLCPRVISLDEGQLVADGSAREIVGQYQLEQFQPSAEWQRPPALKPSPDLEFTAVRVRKQSGQVCGIFSGDEPITIEIEYCVKHHLNGCSINAWLYNAQGSAIFCTADNDASLVSALPRDPGKYQTRFLIPGNLLTPGSCSLRLGAHLPGRTIYDQVEYPVTFEVCLDGSYASLDDRRFGVAISPLMIWETCKIGI
jgi:lipopolysaccharide transport system ATP-binding protein